MKRIYIAGPMSGYESLNWAAFDHREETLNNEGWDCVNPARLDREAGIDPTAELGDYDYTAAALRDVEALLSCQAIYLMNNWQLSRGASWERALAVHHNIRRFYEVPRLEDF